MAQKNPLWDVIQAYMDDPKHRYAPRPADLARETGVSDQVLSKWKAKPTLPTSEQLIRVARGTGIPYVELLLAAMRGKGYLPPSQARAIASAVETAAGEPDWIDSWMRHELEIEFMHNGHFAFTNELCLIIADLMDGGDGTGGGAPTQEAVKAAWPRVRALRERWISQNRPAPRELSGVDRQWMARSADPLYSENPNTRGGDGDVEEPRDSAPTIGVVDESEVVSKEGGATPRGQRPPGRRR